MSSAPRVKGGVWSLGPSVYLPSLLFGIGQGAIAPAIALSAHALGATLAVSSLVVALLGLGRIVGDVPAGVLVTKIGERRLMLIASAVAMVALFVCATATTVWVLCIGITCTGLCTAVWGLARHTYLAEVIPYENRGRALSTLGGTQRIGVFIGPFLGAIVMAPLGIAGAYWVHIVMAAATAITLLIFRDPPIEHPVHVHVDGAVANLGTLAVVRQHLPVLRTLGMGALMISAVRASRQVIIPLWADQIHLAPVTTSIIFGLSGAVDMLLFYPGGLAMDRFGRRPLVVLSMLCLGVAHLILPLTTNAVSLAAVAMFMGFGNGMGSGINMTIGADASPAANRGTFLGAWRLLSDFGNGAGPLVISGIVALSALGPAALVMGGLAGVCAIGMARWLPRGRPGSRRPPPGVDESPGPDPA
jgi:MFS family permease